MTMIQLKNLLLYVCWWAIPATKYSNIYSKQEVLLFYFMLNVSSFLIVLIFLKMEGPTLKMYFW